jgi:hypothetical protein
MDLRHELWGPRPMGLRRLRSLLSGLPWDSQLGRVLEVPDPAQTRWGNAEELLTILVNLTDMSIRNFIMANSKKGTPPPKPFVKITKPHEITEEKKPKRQATPDEMRAFFGGNVRYAE